MKTTTADGDSVTGGHQVGHDAGTGRAARPPAGWVDRHAGMRILGVGKAAWDTLERAGTVCCGQWFPRHGGGRTKLYPVDALERLMRETNGFAFPPPGMVDRHEAARMFGVAARTWSTWESEGRVTCGRVVPVPGKPARQKIYPVEELHRLVEAFKTAPPFPPPGFVGRDDACRVFGVAIRTWVTWEAQGRITCGRSVPVPGKPGRCKIYPVEELTRLAEEFRRAEEEAARRFEPCPDPDRPGCYRVPVVSQVLERLEAIIDAESLPLVQGKRWWWSQGSNGHGTVVLAIGGTPRPSLHQIIMGVRGAEFRVGHLNGDPLDCRRANLIVRNCSEQKAATRKVTVKAGRATSSRFKGVSRRSAGERWAASISGYGAHRPLGRFRSEVGAALAYDDAARELFGGHAQLNFPDADEAARMRAVAADQEAAPPVPFPARGMIDRRGACRMFGVEFKAWEHWERTGRVRCGRWAPRPAGKPGRCRVYPVEELHRLLEEFERVGKPYPDPDRPGCWRVPIRSFVHRMEAVIDADALPIVQGHNWNWAPHTGGDGRVALATTGRQTPLARLIAGVTDPDLKVSHANRDPLDCRRSNLLVRTMAEQAPGNRKMGTVSGRKYTSRFKGVSWSEQRGKWVVQISHGEMHRTVGRFDDEIAAAEAYDEAARELFGEHAHLNFPDGVDAFLEAEADVEPSRAAA